MNERFRRILSIFVFFVIASVLIFLVYFVFFRQAPSPVNNENVNNTPSGTFPNINRADNANVNINVNGVTQLPTPDVIAHGGATQITELTPGVSIIAPSEGVSGDLRYYRPNDGHFYKVDKNGTSVALGDAIFPDVQSVIFAPTTNEAIMEFPDGSNIYYNFDTERQVTLPKEYTEFSFAPNASAIAFKYMHIDPERRVLAVSNPDGSGVRTLEPLGRNDDRVTVAWSPTGKVAATWSEFIDTNRQELGFIGLNNENFLGTVVEGRGLQYQYSADGQRLLYSVFSPDTNYTPELWLVDADGNAIGQHRMDLGIKTSADKCGMSSDGKYAYCGVPTNAPDGFGLVPEYLKGVTDTIVRIDLQNGTSTRIAIPVDSNGHASYQTSNIEISDDGSTLYFRDTKSGELIKLRLQ